MVDVYFINTAHVGDVMIPIRFIEEFANNYLKGKTYYVVNRGNCHPDNVNYTPKIIVKNITDINLSGLKKIESANYKQYDTYKYFQIYNNSIYINLWFPALWDHGFDIKIDLTDLYSVFKSIYAYFDITINTSIKQYLPRIPFTSIPTLTTHASATKIIMICNGHCNSGQVANIDLDPYIKYCIDKNCFVIITHKSLVRDTDILKSKQVIYISDITKNESNIREIMYISGSADIIIGRDSGLFFVTQLYENLHKKFICITEGQTKIYHEFDSKQLLLTKATINDIYEQFKVMIDVMIETKIIL
jgi:hypothetical protein